MNSAAVKHTNQRMPFEVILGPMMILLTISMLFLKAAAVHWLLPFIAITAIPLCWRWRWSGLVVSVSCVAAFIGMAYQKAPLSEILWFSGFSLSLSLAYVTTLLAWSEVESSAPHPETLSLAEPIPETVQQIDKTPFEDQIHALTESLNAMRIANQEYADTLYSQHMQYETLNNEKEGMQEEIQMIQHELQTALAKQESLVEDLIGRDHQISTLTEQLTTSSALIQSLKNDVANANKERDRLTDIQADHGRELSLLQEKKALIEQAAQASLVMSEEWQAKAQSLETELTKAGESKEMLSSTVNFLTKQLEETQSQSEQLQTTVKLLEKQLAESGYERDQLGKLKKNTRSVESMYIQLKKQFEEKSKTLDDTRRELFLVNERVLSMEREREEQRTYGEGSEGLKSLLETQALLEEEIEHLNDLVAALSKG